MARALINIDYTNDFVNGALPCGEPAIAIEDEIVRITADFIKNGDLTILAIDRHEKMIIFILKQGYTRLII